MQKLLEIKGLDWTKGLSIQSGFPIGGLFRQAINFDPFEKIGYLQPSLTEAEISSGSFTTTPKYVISFTDGIDGYAYVMSDRAGTGTVCLQIIKLSDDTVTNYSSQILTNTTTGAVTMFGGIVYKGKFVYFCNSGSAGAVAAELLPNGTEIIVLVNPLVGFPTTINDPCIGPDGNLYYLSQSGFAIGKITAVDTTTGNTNSAFAMESGMYPRSITNDGRYLVFIGDNNFTKKTTITSSCKVYFWDTNKATADAAYNIPDSYVIAARSIKGTTYVLGYSGLWACNIATEPKLIFPMTPDMLPSGPNMVTVRQNILYWASATVGSSGYPVYAFGSLTGKPVLFNPFLTSNTSEVIDCLASSGTQFLAGITGSGFKAVYRFNSGTTRSTATVQTAPIPLENPATISFIKVVLKNPLSSGQSVVVNAKDSNDTIIVDNTSQAYNSANPKKSLIFTAKPTAGSKSQFEDIAITVAPAGGAVVQRVSVYGELQPDSQTI